MQLVRHHTCSRTVLLPAEHFAAYDGCLRGPQAYCAIEFQAAYLSSYP